MPSTVPGFNQAFAYAGLGGEHGLALDPHGRRLVITTYGRPPRVYGFGQIVSAEVQTDTETVTTTNGRIDMKCAVVATALIGPLGLAAGAKVTSTSVAKVEISVLSLVLYINDLHAPVWTIPFLLGGLARPADDPDLRRAAKEVGAWFGRFKAITADQSLPAPSATVSPSASLLSQPVEPSQPLERGWASRVFGS